MKFRKKPVVIEAAQWFKNGDHPDDKATEMFDYPDGSRPQVIREGTVVRYYRHPGVPGDSPCEQCGKPHHVHGWIDTLEQGHRVCPGDWIITGVKGERYPCKPDIFAATYEAEREPLPDRDPTKSDAEQGLYHKFNVVRTDGSSAPGGKHRGCDHFVLDLTHDAHARAAILAYARACKGTHPKLAGDLFMRYGKLAEISPEVATAVREAAARGECVTEVNGQPIFMTLDGTDPALPSESEGGEI